MDWSKITDQANDLFKKLHEIHVDFYHLWRDDVLFSWRWWFALSLIIIPWMIWFFIRKKESSDRLLYAGLMSMLLSSFLDVIGIALGLWTYPANVFPLMPEFIPLDISTVPVTTMLFIQFFPRIKAFYKAFIYAAVGAFIFEPLVHKIGIYDRLGWKGIYSFPILIGIYLVANYFATRDKFSKIR